MHLYMIIYYIVKEHREQRDPAHRDCNVKIKINHKIPMVFHNLKNSYLIMQELGKTSVIK